MKYIIIFAVVSTLSGYATSMTPSQVMERLPTATKSEFYEYADAQQAISNGTCELLVPNRSYVAPMGLTVVDDLKNGAIGIDEWVQVDHGNAFRLDNFEWVAVGDSGATQLTFNFDTMLCGQTQTIEEGQSI